MSEIKNVVLVHGFWIDASSYSQVVSMLLAEGYEVVAVQNPLTSLADDVAATKRALARLDGPCILVGHSWGGMVITEAGNDERVAGLVYIAAPAPDAGEAMVDVMSKYEPPSPQHVQEQEGFIWLSREGVHTMFAHDLSAGQKDVLYATQVAPSASLVVAKVTAAAWRKKPSWYIVASNDKAVSPNLQHEMSQRIGAETTIVKSSHVTMISHAKEVVDVIKAAAKGALPA
ncbi:MAG TPA: alpha/beta hydrolase [Leptolyngbyaceae cyanobacterium]